MTQNINTLPKDLCLFISSPDSYSDVFDVFLKYLRKNWPNCPYEIILSTNSMEYEGITVFRNFKEKDGWMDRAIPVLKQIPYEFVLLLCDDCIITKKVDNEAITSILNDMKEHSIDFVGFSNHIKGKRLTKTSLINLVKQNKAYALNLQSGIYRKAFLLKQIGDGIQTPWELESLWLEKAAQAPNAYFKNIGSENSNIMGIRNGVLKGMWYYSVAQMIKEDGISIDDRRAVMSLKEQQAKKRASKIGKILPARLRTIVKRIMKKHGMSFATKN